MVVDASEGMGTEVDALDWKTASWQKDELPGILGSRSRPLLGLALGGGFARGMAHIGVLQAFEEEGIGIDRIAGVSSGAIVAAAYASGTRPEEIAKLARAMRFNDFARWTFCKLGFCCTDGMNRLLTKLLKKTRFEDMEIPAAIGATDLQTGETITFKDSGDVRTAVRASCAFPGIFQPVAWENRMLTDGAISMEVPARMARELGADRVVSVCLPHDLEKYKPQNFIDIMTRSLQIMQLRTEDSWKRYSDIVIVPEVADWAWHDFRNSQKMIEAGASAARKAMPTIREQLKAEPMQALAPVA